ncbi:MAG: FAD-dependent oxidoreductase [Planctomycetota bacterium]
MSPVARTSTEPEVAIVGGGLAGALLAVELGRKGRRVALYEQRPDLRKTQLVRGRSINLAISTRGLTALDSVGLKQRVLDMAVAMPGRMIHAVSGELSFQPYGVEGQAIHSVSRTELNRLLLSEAEALPNVALHFGQKCVDADFDSDRAAVTVEFESQLVERVKVRAPLVVGSDGAFSAVRRRLLRRDRFSYSQEYLAHGYKELHIPPAAGGGFRIERNALHIWPRRSFMMIALPNNDGSFTCTLFWPLDGEFGFANLKTAEDVQRFFGTHFADAVPLMPTLVEDYLSTAPSTLVTMRCYPWSIDSRFTMIGDACHAVVPFYGQGMNAAFEDCTVLSRCLDEHGADVARALDEYQRLRKPNVDALAELAVENFIEMRDHVASPFFLFKKRVGALLHKLMPRLFVPLYTMISFTNLPYAEARARARWQARIIQRVIVGLGLLLLLAILGVFLWR